MKKMLLLITLFSSVSCSTVSLSHSEDGNDIYVANCNGDNKTIADCRKHASQVCNGHFKIIDQEKTKIKSKIMADQTEIKRIIMFYCTNGEKADLNRLK